ncbi:hypothetical protein AYO38_02440 [bacterium SCGC AG-212-C10]|nr:hypothetical protein AYO38_02440 [bacterium SCGC AG-212-C10]
MVDDDATLEQKYTDLLQEFCENGGEDVLYRASLLSQDFIAAGLAPDELVALHTDAVQTVVKPFDARSLVTSQQLLLEVMIAYGVRYSEYAEFRLAEAKKAAENEQLRATAATRESESRMELLSAVSHELATPLTVAKGNVEAIRRFLSENNRLSHELSTRAIDAEMAIERLLSLREELLAASRNETRELELGPLHVENAVTRAVNWAAQAAKDKSIDLKCEFGASDSSINADPDAMQSILGNLLSNAIRYTPPGGTVSVVTRVEDGRVVVDIRDTGIGLTEDAKERLFERFYRAPEAKQVATWGMGLGLAIASDLARALGATISADGAPGCGSTFTVSFPQAVFEMEE